VLLSSPTLTPCHPCHYIDPPSPCVASADPEIKKVRSDRALRELRAMQGLGGEKGEEDMMQMDVVAEGMCAMMMMIMMMPPPPPARRAGLQAPCILLPGRAVRVPWDSIPHVSCARPAAPWAPAVMSCGLQRAADSVQKSPTAHRIEGGSRQSLSLSLSLSCA
jgi:hypothetical protein